jgi:hypothetical protein
MVAAALVAFFLLGPSVRTKTMKASDTGSVDELLAHIKGKSAWARVVAYNQAIRHLWDGYQRHLAVQLIKELARDHRDEFITQYWLDQVKTVEPQLIISLGNTFFNRHYQPEVAAQCGSFG